MSPGHEVTTTEAHLPCQRVKSLLKSGDVSRKTRALEFFPYFILYFKKPQWVGHTQIHTCPHIHSLRKGVSFGDVCTECTGCQPLHRAKCSAAEIALIIWAVFIHIQNYKNIAFVDVCNYYLVLGNIMWSWNNQWLQASPLCLFANCHVNELLTSDCEESVSDYTTERWKLQQWAW